MGRPSGLMTVNRVFFGFGIWFLRHLDSPDCTRSPPHGELDAGVLRDAVDGRKLALDARHDDASGDVSCIESASTESLVISARIVARDIGGSDREAVPVIAFDLH
jgi:hypothetical protein